MVFYLWFLVGVLAEPAPPTHFQPTGSFGELAHVATYPHGTRVWINLPGNMAGKRRVLVVYATPNGSTVEQTLGCATKEGLDWKFDIQHIGAQTRQYRSIHPEDAVILAVVQAPKLSWPAFRSDFPGANSLICQILADLERDWAPQETYLACHSGGGSFIFGALEGWKEVPPTVRRLIFLDANYAYDDGKSHGETLSRWLRASPNNHLVVIAYDDREILLNGKKVVGPTGGTWRATDRMISRLGKDWHLEETQQGPFIKKTAKNGQLLFLAHPNPENRILHTALVGEMNGLLEGLLTGSPMAKSWGTFGGPRSYTPWVQKEPPTDPLAPTCEEISLEPGFHLKLPPRPANAPGGKAFVDQLMKLGPEQRDQAIRREMLVGNIPDTLRKPASLKITQKTPSGKTITALIRVAPDYLGVGSDKDWVRLPLTPGSAWLVADAAGCSLPTPKVVDCVNLAAKSRLTPLPLTTERESPATFLHHHEMLEEAIRKSNKTGLIGGLKKDIVWSNQLRDKRGKVAIYGWHQANGVPIQPAYSGHSERYVDYSQGIRLVYREMVIQGKNTDYHQALKDPELHSLLSGEGILQVEDLLGRITIPH